MENSDIDVLIGMLEDGIDAGYDEYDDITYYNFKREYESSNEIKSLLDKIGVKYRKEFDDDLDEFDLSDENLIIDYGEEQKIKDWLKSNKKQLMEYLKTKDKKTIGRFALIFGEALDEDLLKEIINSYNIDENEYHEYDEFGLDYFKRGKILSYIKDPIYLKYILVNSGDFHINIDNFVYTQIIKSINDVSQIKNYIEKAEPYDNYGIAELVISLNDPDYTKKIIEDREKYGLEGHNLVELVESLNEPEYTKNIIENKEKYGLDGYNVVVLVESLNEPEYTKKIIKDREKYGLYGYEVRELLTRDKDILKEIIINREEYQLSARDIAIVAFGNFSGEELLEFIDKEVSEIYRNKYASIEFIKENLSRFRE